MDEQEAEGLVEQLLWHAADSVLLARRWGKHDDFADGLAFAYYQSAQLLAARFDFEVFRSWPMPSQWADELRAAAGL